MVITFIVADVDCMTSLIDLAGVSPRHRNQTIDIFRDQEIDQELVHDMREFRDFIDFMRLTGVNNLNTRLRLFKCLNNDTSK